jgi:hypothetical protein
MNFPIQVLPVLSGTALCCPVITHKAIESQRQSPQSHSANIWQHQNLNMGCLARGHATTTLLKLSSRELLSQLKLLSQLSYLPVTLHKTLSCLLIPLAKKDKIPLRSGSSLQHRGYYLGLLVFTGWLNPALVNFMSCFPSLLSHISVLYSS